MEHAQRPGGLPGPHRDPFDCILIAQAGLESLPVVSADPVFAAYRVPAIWDAVRSFVVLDTVGLRRMCRCILNRPAPLARASRVFRS
jgi:hypothetical protein